MSNDAYTTPSYLGAPTTGDHLAAVTPDAVRRLWKAGVDTFEETSDFFAEMEGRSPMSLIQTETDTSKGAGQKITFTVDSGLYGEAHLGEDLFTDSSHYEDLKLGTNDLTVDWFRHGVRFTERAEEKMGMRGELIDRVPEKLGEWAGRLKTEKMFMMFQWVKIGHFSLWMLRLERLLQAVFMAVCIVSMIVASIVAMFRFCGSNCGSCP